MRTAYYFRLGPQLILMMQTPRPLCSVRQCTYVMSTVLSTAEEFPNLGRKESHLQWEVDRKGPRRASS